MQAHPTIAGARSAPREPLPAPARVPGDASVERGAATLGQQIQFGRELDDIIASRALGPLREPALGQDRA